MTTTLDKKSERLAIKPPSMFNVVLHNDDFTSMEFVIALLTQIFKKSLDEAMAITQHVHENGKGVAGQYTRDIAETRKTEAIQAARRYEHPLNITVEAA